MHHFGYTGRNYLLEKQAICSWMNTVPWDQSRPLLHGGSLNCSYSYSARALASVVRAILVVEIRMQAHLPDEFPAFY